MLRGLFGGSNKKPEEKGISPPPKLTTAVIGSINTIVGAHSIPPMPGAAQKAFSLSINPKAEARDFIDVIESDEGLSARVLKIANSVFFDRGRLSKTIEEAVLVIGINELRCLLNSTTLSEIFPSRSRIRAQLWSNDVATAIVARSLAQNYSGSRSELAFLAGLMHDIGKLLILQKASVEYRRVINLVERDALEFDRAEEQIFMFDHTEVGQLIAERWKFTTEITAAIRYHHLLWSDLAIHQASPSITVLVKAADLISHSEGFGHPRTFGKFREKHAQSLGEVWEALGMTAGDKKDMLASLRRQFELEYELYVGSEGK